MTSGRATFRSALAAEQPLVTPLAHDALSARLIELAGFRAFNIGGSSLLAVRHALPDLGLVGLGEMRDGIRDIAAASSLPFMADADDGYGDVKSVARTVIEYETIGVGGMLIEDQARESKRQRAEKSAGVVEEQLIERKLKVALDTRGSAETLIIGRTDAYGALGLDAALRRAGRFLDLGADGVFIAGLRSADELGRVGEEFRGALLLAAMFEGMDTPWLAPAELGRMGFSQITYPVSLVFRAVDAMSEGLRQLRAFGLGQGSMEPLQGNEARKLLDEAVHLARWQEIESRHVLPGSNRE